MDRVHYFTDYPFADLAERCKGYINNMDWDGIDNTAGKKQVAMIDVSDCIGLFRHMQLDGDYRLMCYIAGEYHGLHGKIAAVKKDADAAARLSEKFNGRLGLIELPTAAANPLEAVYNDGSDEGFLEAVLFAGFISYLPNSRFMYCFAQEIVTEIPQEDIPGWDVFVDVRDMRPKAVWEGQTVSVYLYRRSLTEAWGSHDGRDDIKLSVHHFYADALHYVIETAPKYKELYRTQLDMNKKYTADRRNCLYVNREICIAKQKARHKINV